MTLIIAACFFFGLAILAIAIAAGMSEGDG